MEQAPDHYAVLGIRPTADPEVIAAAYRALVKKFHPDTGNQSGTASPERFQAVQQAYEVLGDPERRRDYDATRQPPEPAQEVEEDLDEAAPPFPFESRLYRPPEAALPRVRPAEEILPGQWTRSPGALPPGPRNAGKRDSGKSSSPWGLMALVAAIVLGGGSAGWFLSGDTPTPPAQADHQTVTKQFKTDASPPEAQSASVPAQQPQAQPQPVAESGSPLFSLVMYEKTGGVISRLGNGGLTFNSAQSCQDFGAAARQRRLDAATIQTGTKPEVWFECQKSGQ